MKRLLFIICALLFVSAGAFAQVGAYSSTATDSFGKRISSPTVKVCAVTDSACSTPVTIYKDSSSAALSNPFTGDTQGNYTFFAAPGSYTVQVAKAGYSAYSYSASIGNTPRESVGTYYTDAAIDSAAYGNECAAINAAWAYATSKGWASVRIMSGWHGVQACGTSDPNADYPALINANPPTFASVLDMQPDNIIQSDNPVVIRTNQKWDFHNPHSGLGATANAIVGGFQSSNLFTTGAVVEFGAPDGTSVTSGGQPQGVQLENAGVYCRGPNGTFRSGSIGVRNQYSQEQSWGKNLRIDGCQYGIDKQDSGTGFGSINDGPWEELHINVGGSNTALSQCLRIGKAGSANANVQNARGFYHISCNTNGASVQPNWGVTVDGAGIPIVDLHTEGFLGAVGLGETGYSKGNTVRDVYCVALGSFTIGTCTDIGAANEFGNTNGNVIANINTSGTATNVFCDNRNTPACATPAVTNTLAFYVHALGGMIISSSPEIPSRMTFATGTALSALSSPTADVAFAMSGHGVTYNASSAQAASMANFQGSSGNTDTHPFINATTANAAEVGYTFSQVGKSKLAPDSNGNVFLQNLQTATSGANINCTTFIQQGRYYTGSASTGENVTPQCVYGSGANPTMTYSFALTNPGTGVHSMDFSNWAKVLSKNISTGTASNTDLAGAVTLAGGTGTYTFAQTYTSAPICTATDSTAAAAVKASTSTTVLTLTGTGTDVINYVCVGRN